ncbi:unnamed protein product [Hermetia illucens]|uniref:Uncharacterized protein n=1 Tax=Hermetia illucens TaxID=343691 RepID=A0A7R8UDN9_HERIL|nr:uncharacterized protein C1orf50 homolog [Hermetia illucens]CAD7078857.1 unnamed protein product [Hermetia illucens]
MKRSSDIDMADLSYDAAMKKVHLVERNRNPNGAHILSLNRVSIHESSDIISLATQIQRADEAVKDVACGKLALILEQIKMLQSQAKRILEETEHNNSLHHAACNFQKVPGQIYHLYQNESGQNLFSMLSPEEWGSSCPHKFLGSYRLERDSTWTPIKNIDERDRQNEWGARLLASANSGDQNMLSLDYEKM